MVAAKSRSKRTVTFPGWTLGSPFMFGVNMQKTPDLVTKSGVESRGNYLLSRKLNMHYHRQ